MIKLVKKISLIKLIKIIKLVEFFKLFKINKLIKIIKVIKLIDWLIWTQLNLFNHCRKTMFLIESCFDTFSGGWVGGGWVGGWVVGGWVGGIDEKSCPLRPITHLGFSHRSECGNNLILSSSDCVITMSYCQLYSILTTKLKV